MKIAYLGKIQLTDTDLPYLHKAQLKADITYIIEINPRFLQGPALNIQHIYPKSGLFKATDIYLEFDKLRGFINLDKCYVLNTCGKMWMLKSFWTHIILLFFLIRNKFSIIHLAWPPNVYEWVLYILCQRMILTVHDPLPHSSNNTRIVQIRRWLAFKLIPNFIILNKAQRQQFIDYYKIDSEHVIQGAMGCCTYLHIVQPDSNHVPPADSYILFAGKISAYKGLHYLLPAMEKVHKNYPECKLIVAGGGKFYFDISHYRSMDYIDIRNRFIPDDELVALIQNCAFMVCPYTDATQSGVIMSAFAFNKPSSCTYAVLIC